MPVVTLSENAAFKFFDGESMSSIYNSEEYFQNIIKRNTSALEKITLQLKEDQSVIFLDKHEEVMNLRIDSDSGSVSLKKLSDLLMEFPSLAELSFYLYQVKNDSPIEGLGSFENLNKLELIHCEWKLLELFRMSTNIESIKIDAGFNQKSSELENFLLVHPNLKEFVFRGDIPFLPSISLYTFSLVKLSVDELPRTNLYDDSSNFLRKQKETLRELHVKNKIADNDLNFVLEELQLTKLQIKIIQGQNNFIYKATENKYLKTLLLHIEGNCAEVLRVIVSNYPDIVTLQIHEGDNADWGKVLEHIAVSCPLLKELLVPCLPGELILAVDFISLKSIYVKNVRTSKEAFNLRFLLIHCPALEVFTIARSAEKVFNNEMIEFALKCPKIQEVCFGMNFEFDDQALNIIRSSNLCNVKVFTTENIDCFYHKVNRVFCFANPNICCFVFERKSGDKNDHDYIKYQEEKHFVHQQEIGEEERRLMIEEWEKRFLESRQIKLPITESPIERIKPESMFINRNDSTQTHSGACFNILVFTAFVCFCVSFFCYFYMLR